ncbi:MAG: hypothetical protein AB4080_15755 [Trichodesmium sp.]
MMLPTHQVRRSYLQLTIELLFIGTYLDLDLKLSMLGHPSTEVFHSSLSMAIN